MARKQPFIWFALGLFRKLVSLPPHKVAVALGGYLGSLVPYFTRKKFQEAVWRCSSVLDVSGSEAKGIVKRSYCNFGRSAAEFARMPIMAPRMDEVVRVHGEENLKRALSAGKGVMIVTAHIGNWEYAAAWCASHGYPINTLGTDQRDVRLTNLIMDLRRAGGSKALGKASDLKAMMRALQAGEIIAVPVDQDARKAGVISNFLGRPASTPIGIAKLADKIGCAIVPGFCLRCIDGAHLEFHILPELTGRHGEPYGKNVQTSIDDCNDIISEWIRKYPDQWMWMYPRWESVESGELDEMRN